MTERAKIMSIITYQTLAQTGSNFSYYACFSSGVIVQENLRKIKKPKLGSGEQQLKKKQQQQKLISEKI